MMKLNYGKLFCFDEVAPMGKLDFSTYNEFERCFFMTKKESTKLKLKKGFTTYKKTFTPNDFFKGLEKPDWLDGKVDLVVIEAKNISFNRKIGLFKKEKKTSNFTRKKESYLDAKDLESKYYQQQMSFLVDGFGKDFTIEETSTKATTTITVNVDRHGFIDVYITTNDKEIKNFDTFAFSLRFFDFYTHSADAADSFQNVNNGMVRKPKSAVLEVAKIAGGITIGVGIISIGFTLIDVICTAVGRKFGGKQ